MSEHRPPEGGYKSNKPKLTKAERRALQEQQRAAKAAAGGKGAGGAAAGGGKPPKPSPSGGEGKANPKGAGNSNSANSANSISSSNANNNANSNSTSNSNSNSTTSSDNNSDNKENQKSLFSHLAAPVEIDPTSLTLSLTGTGGESLFNSPFSTSTSTSTSTSSSTSRSSTSSSSALHPSIIELGYAYASGKTKGSTRRCREMLLAFMQVVQDFEPSEGTSDTSGSSAMGGKGQGSNGSNGRGGGGGGQNQNQNQNQKTHKTGRGRMKGGVYKELSTSLKNAFSYLTSLRPHSISMGNAFKSLKKSVNTIPVDLPFDGQGGGRERILEEIDRFINERITLPQGVIADIAITKINRGDVVLTYGDSEVIRKVLKAGYERDLQRNKNGEVGFRVVVVDSRPLMEGKSMVKYLSLECPEMEVAYVLLSGLSYVMRDVKKVFVPSSSLLRNGSSLSRSGTAAIALVASSMNVPVLVCCETFKLSNRVMLDGCGWNERGGEEAVRETPHKSPEDPLNGWRSHPNLNLLSLKYDVCPSEYISATITEYGILPPSSVAVLLREINADDNDFEDL